MTPEQMRERSGQKVKQVMELAKMLQLKLEAKERITQDGFVEKVVFWIDEEKYPNPVTPELAMEGTDITSVGATGEKNA